MQLTESEKKEIEKAKNISVRWPKTRWLALLVGVIIIALIVIYLYDGSQLSVGIVCGFAGYMSVRNMILTAKWWNGIVPYKLLLKLWEETANRTN
jgi:hypothetical protein